MWILTAVLAFALATTASAQDAPRDPVGRAGDVLLSVNGGFAPPGVEGRYYVADGVPLTLAFDRAVFGDADPTVTYSPLAESGAEAWTLSASVEREDALASWAVVGYGVQAFAQRQRSGVVVGRDRGFPVVDEGARLETAAGAVFTVRMEARVVGALRVGAVGSYAGLGVRQTVGGTREADGQVAPATPADERARLSLGGGSTRLYLGVRL